MDRFKDRVVLVTGGAAGIGRAAAEAFAREGAVVGVLDIDEAGAAQTVQGLTGLTGRGVALTGDVRSEVDLERAVGHLLFECGRVDVLVNNAFHCGVEDLLDSDQAAFDVDVDVVLNGAVRCIRAVLPTMLACGTGSVVSISSVNALAGFGNDAYSAAKGALMSLTRTLAVRHGAAGVRFNAVVPGTVRTSGWDSRLAANPELFSILARHYPLGRIGEPRDVTGAVLFLASDEASWITGTALVVDGGLLAGSRAVMSDAAL